MRRAGQETRNQRSLLDSNGSISVEKRQAPFRHSNSGRTPSLQAGGLIRKSKFICKKSGGRHRHGSSRRATVGFAGSARNFIPSGGGGLASAVARSALCGEQGHLRPPFGNKQSARNRFAK